MTHPTHKTRISDASTFDEICVHCGATDTWGSNLLNLPCPGPAPVGHPPPPPTIPVQRPDARYEYKTVMLSWEREHDGVGADGNPTTLEKLAAEGWEMCGCYQSPHNRELVRAFFKRPKGGA